MRAIGDLDARSLRRRVTEIPGVSWSCRLCESAWQCRELQRASSVSLRAGSCAPEFEAPLALLDPWRAFGGSSM